MSRCEVCQRSVWVDSEYDVGEDENVAGAGSPPNIRRLGRVAPVGRADVRRYQHHARPRLFDVRRIRPEVLRGRRYRGARRRCNWLDRGGRVRDGSNGPGPRQDREGHRQGPDQRTPGYTEHRRHDHVRDSYSARDRYGHRPADRQAAVRRLRRDRITGCGARRRAAPADHRCRETAAVGYLRLRDVEVPAW